MDFQTIAAISTPYGRGGIAVIRISGSEAVKISEKMFFPSSGKKLSEYPANRMMRGDVRLGERSLDDGMAVIFRAPHSYTGEDTVEIYCHGGILVSGEVLRAAFSCGAVPAEPGEYTKRAFINGKITLSAAEAVINTIDAETSDKLALARSQSRGILSGAIEKIYEKLCKLASEAYVTADYPDEDLADMTPGEMLVRLRGILGDIGAIADTYKAGKAINEGIYTVIAGRPNTGKSSLLNMLIGSDRAIVSPLAGTTRDSIEETVPVGRILLRLCDTAGIRGEGFGEIEKLGIERSISALGRAGLIIAVFDGSEAAGEEDRAFIGRLGEYHVPKIAVINKKDAGVVFDAGELTCGGFDRIFFISAKTGDGSEELKDGINSLFIDGKIDYESDAIVTSARQKASLDKASKAVAGAISALESGFTPDVAGLDIEEAMSALGEIDGRTVSEDIVHGIFSRFCVGK